MDFHDISWLWVSSFLILWTIFSGNKAKSKTFSKLFFAGLPFLMVSIFLQSGFSPKFIFVLGKDLVITAALATFFSFLKGNKIVALGFFIAFLFAGVQWLRNDAPPIEDQDAPLIYQETEINNDWELLVVPGEDYDRAAYQSILDKYNLKSELAFENVDDAELTDLDEMLAVGIPDKQESKFADIKKELESVRGIRWVEPIENYHNDPIESEINYTQKEKIGVNDPLTVNQWALNSLGMSEFYEMIQSEEIKPIRKTKLAIIDSGVQADHEDLKDHYRSLKSKHDSDAVGHGTHCAGIAAAVTNNGKGIASYDPTGDFVEIMSVKAMNALGMGTQKSVIQAMIDAIDGGADVLSVSLGGRTSQKKELAFKSLVEYAEKNDVILVVAAGNSSMSATKYSPANTPGVITVAALNEQNELAKFSNTVDELAMGIAAPGTNILSTYPTNKYKTLSGTSMATPYVSGLVAVLKSIQPELNAYQAYEVLKDSGLNTMAGNEQGKRINPSAALSSVIAKQAISAESAVQ